MSSLNLTPREEELLCAVVEVMKSEIVWADVASKASFTNAKQARDKWTSVRTKIIASGNKTKEASDAGPETTTAVSATPKKAAPKKRKAASESGAKSKKSKKTVPTDDDGEEAQVKSQGDNDEDGN